MTALTADHARGFVHAAGFYGSDQEFVSTFAPFCEAGVARGEPTLVRLAAHKADLLRSAVSNADGIVFLPHDDQYVHPPGALANVVELVGRYSNGARRPMRLLGELPTLDGLARDAWIRYEAAANMVLRDRPLLGLCPFDTRVTPEAVQAEVLRTHHVVVGTDGQPRQNGRYEGPAAFMAGPREVVRDPLEDGSPDIDLLEPTPAAGRHAVDRLATAVGLDPDAAEGLLIGVSEVLTNAILHGGSPGTLRAWGRAGRVIVAVRDSGDGPAEPFTGLLPVTPGSRIGGLGLWITHQLCPEVGLSRADGGFTVRLGAGALVGAPR
jgi:anti-sigma regulatory factor (Ser/Thr protein kinase)